MGGVFLQRGYCLAAAGLKRQGESGGSSLGAFWFGASCARVYRIVVRDFEVMDVRVARMMSKTHLDFDLQLLTHGLLVPEL